jgi:ABC-2 type transport system ATP-binding protein
MIAVDRLTKSFRNLQAVKELSFTVQPGEILGLLGPNGAGKTTTLRSLAGVIRPESGTISIGGLNLTQSPIQAKQMIAYLPDQSSFFDNLTCWEHIQFVAEVYQIKDFQPLANQLFDRFELADKKNKFPSDLSKGMRQRLGLISAFIHNPKVLLLDEPMTGLDPKGIRTVNEMVKEAALRGASIILSSHLLSILEEICTKVLILNHGKSLLYGALEEIRAESKKLNRDASLEGLFFHATHQDESPT